MSEQLIALLYQRTHTGRPDFPDKDLAINFTEALFRFLFVPGKAQLSGKVSLRKAYDGLRNTFSALVFDMLPDKQQVTAHTDDFFDTLHIIYEQLLKDAAAILAFDPAAVSVQEVLTAYPGFFATAVYRIAHQLYRQQLAALPRLLTEYAHSRTGIDIHPGAQIGESFFIDHGTGIVIGETTVIGNHVKIYQGVTIGALNVAKQLAAQKRHPTIEDNVIIYSGATILGGETVIGHDSIIGGNVWLTSSIAPYSIVYHKSEVVLRDKFPLPEPLNFVI